MSGPDPTPFNPYAPPAVDGGAMPVDPKTADLAERLARLGASVLDSVLIWLALLPAVFSTWADVLGALRSGTRVSNLWWIGGGAGQLAATILVSALVALQSYLIATTGQSIGKRLAHVRIVQMSGKP